jgi:hypothetical protein
MAFFFICFLNTAISYSVSFSHGAYTLPGFASAGGGDSWARALLVEIPATWLCTFVPMTPGGRTRADLGVFGLPLFGLLTLPVPVASSMFEPTSDSSEVSEGLGVLTGE